MEPQHHPNTPSQAHSPISISSRSHNRQAEQQQMSSEGGLTLFKYEQLTFKESNLHKVCCRHFEPSAEYFRAAPKTNLTKYAELIPSAGKYEAIEAQQSINNLSIGKQLEYLRGSLKQWVPEQLFVDEYHSDQDNHGMIGRMGNCGVVIASRSPKEPSSTTYDYIYGINDKLMRLQLTVTTKPGSKSVISHTCSEILDAKVVNPILELKHMENEPIIIIRTRYTILLYSNTLHSLTNSKLSLHSSGEITCMEYNPHINPNTILVGIYDQGLKKCTVQQWHFKPPTRKRVIYKGFSQSYINTIRYLNDREVIMCFVNKISILDIRIRKQFIAVPVLEDFIRVTQISNDADCHFWTIELIRDSEILVVSSNEHIYLYHISDPSGWIARYSHMCQENPPCVIQSSPLGILTHSAGELGCALLLQPQERGVSHQLGDKLWGQKNRHNWINGQQTSANLLFSFNQVCSGNITICALNCIQGDGYAYMISANSAGGVHLQVLAEDQGTARYSTVPLQSDHNRLAMNTEHAHSIVDKYICERIEKSYSSHYAGKIKEPNQESDVQQYIENVKMQSKIISDGARINKSKAILTRKLNHAHLDAFYSKLAESQQQIGMDSLENWMASCQVSTFPSSLEVGDCKTFKESRRPRPSTKTIDQQLLQEMEKNWGM